MSIEEAREKFVGWLEGRMTAIGRGDGDEVSDHVPSGKYWLGRLLSAEAVADNDLGDRGERLEPCAIGIKIKPARSGPWQFHLSASMRVWLKGRGQESWRKSKPAEATVTVSIPASSGLNRYGETELSNALADVTGGTGLSARFEVEVENGADGEPEITVLLVNTSPKSDQNFKDTRLYECSLSLSGLERRPFLLESLEDSFRYDRRVEAFGVNCGVRYDSDGALTTEDAITVDRFRPSYWSVDDPMPDLRFEKLGKDSAEPAAALLDSLERWGERNWSPQSLDQRASREGWSEAMRAKAQEGSAEFYGECARLRRGIELLDANENLSAAFRGMNRAMQHSARGKYDSWRPFQFGFLLANLASIVDKEEEAGLADVVWFATGGGKTETYLGLLITAALYDRLTGKISGITAWSRFPLRMLSLQQTQRFADALAAAELVRRDLGLKGAPFSLGTR